MPKFISRYPNYLIVVRPGWREVVEGRVVVHQGKSIQFQPGGLASQGEYTTDDPEEIEFLRKHPRYGVQIVEAGAKMNAAQQEATQSPANTHGLSDEQLEEAVKAWLKSREGAANTDANQGNGEESRGDDGLPSTADIEPGADGFFSCPVEGCGKRFGGKAQLNGHMLSHRKQFA